MSFSQAALTIGERIAWPDVLSLAVIDRMVGHTRRTLLEMPGDAEQSFVQDMSAYPIATHTTDANAQHYEMPAEFFALILGPQRKYSCCLYDEVGSSLAAAEERALEVTAANATLRDGQRILELGCGWGSLSLWMAQRYPASEITAVSNSHSQRAFIVDQARHRGLHNLQVETADMNEFIPQGRFDRVVSIEMFEHMANWRPLLARVCASLEDNGRLFLHVFSHRQTPYRFATGNDEDWIGQHFFSGGLMPSHSLIRQFPDLFAVESESRWSGAHYERTARDWLANYDRNATEIRGILRHVYGQDARLWQRRWRLFFLATMGLFGHASGNEWGVSHYRLLPVR